MIYLRLDERLLHGQVTTTWISVLGVTHIILADDKVSNDTVHCQLLKMSAPKETRLLITSVEKAKKVLNDPRSRSMKILTICSNLDDVLTLIKNVPDIKDVNLANYGFQANQNVKEKQMLTSNLQVDGRELEIVKAIMEKKEPKVYCQVLASQASKPIVIK